MSRRSTLKRIVMHLTICAACVIVINVAQAGSRPPLWVKAQGRIDRYGRLMVEKIKQRKPGHRFIFEGIVKTEPGADGTIELAGIEIKPQPNIKYTYISGKPAARQAVRRAVRVKAIGSFDNRKFYAEEIRIFQYSDDDDVEVEGPIRLVTTLKDGRRLFRVGSMLMLLKGGINMAGPKPKPQPSWLREHVNLSGKVKFVDNTRATDIPEEDLGGVSRRYAKLQTTMQTEFSKRLQAYSRVEFVWRDRIPVDPTVTGTDQNFELRIRDLYLTLNHLVGVRGLQFQIGRQRFRDFRTWLIDSRLNAIQLAYKKPRLQFSAAATRGFGERLFHRDQLHYIASAYFKFGRALTTRFYAIKEVDERTGRDDPLWLAVQTRGKVAHFLEYWAQGARYSSQDGDIRRLGYGFDAGAVVRPFFKRTGPFVSYHFAYGSADNPATDTVRERFRQPRLQLNYYKYGTRNRLYYYGSLLSPELSNMIFHSFGLGYRFSKKVSLQSIWRTYRQINASETIYSNSLGVKPEGIAKNLGNDAEFVIHLLPWKPLEFSLSAEWFMPGNAFPVDTNTVFRLRTDLVFYF